jgi:hypothetical protein
MTLFEKVIRRKASLPSPSDKLFQVESGGRRALVEKN